MTDEQPADSQTQITIPAAEMSNGTTGLDCGAKINLANASLGSHPGTITVSRACGLVWSSPVTLSTDHNLQIIEAGTYLFNGIYVQGRNQLSGLGASTVLKLAPQQSYPARGLAGIRLSDANDRLWAASSVSIANLALDGNYMASTACSNGLQCAVAIFMPGTANSAVSNVTISRVFFTGWRGANVKFGNFNNPPSNIKIAESTFKDCVTQCIESTGFRSDIEILNNQFLGWGIECPKNCDAIFMYPNLPKDIAYDQHNLTITGNTFLNTYHATKFATELFGGSDAGARFTNVTYANNTHDNFNSPGGGSGFSATILGGLVTKNIWKNGCGNQRCGIELSASNVTVSDNNIQNGTISIGGNDDAGQVFTAVHDTVSHNTITIAAQDGKGIKVASVSGAVVTGNIISTDGSSGSCEAIIVGIRGTSFGTVQDARVEGNMLDGSSTSQPSVCSAVRIANSPAHPGSAIAVDRNTIKRFGIGVYDSQNDSSLKDIAVRGNVFTKTTERIHLDTPGAVIERHGNVSE